MRAAVVGTVALVLTLLTSVAAPSASAQSRDPLGCATTLDCSLAEIDAMTMPDRLEFLRAMSEGPAADIVGGHAPRWGNIEGIIAFFAAHEMGASGTWVSYVDAGILEGIERGIAIASGRGTDTFGNPGSLSWASYLQRLRDGELESRSAHDRAWSEAEQAATDHGVFVAEQVNGIAPSAVEQRFFAYSEFYRWALRTRPALLDVVSPGVRPGETVQLTFVDWFTDVTNPVPARKGADLALDLAEFDLAGGPVSGLLLLHAYAIHLAPDYLAAARAHTS
ncbi:hypothetical protein [Prauserella cavernicola]|uniref:Uncharacterized protein n=1 Tax=Prauserella cavernicola TaxID=2800127 RepID=A0A934QV52_9PSEU|nr:hypothetical protein [Prauserella cavernicola]MBK1785888.1 hypothetical protein [Prauserella cavernicola]